MLRVFSIALLLASWALSAPLLGVAQQQAQSQLVSACSVGARSASVSPGGGAAEQPLDNESAVLPAHLYCPLDADDRRLRNDVAELGVAVRDHSHAAAAGARVCVSSSAGHTTSCGPYAFSADGHTGLAYVSPSRDVWLTSGSSDDAYIIVQLPPADGARALAGRSGLVGYRWWDTDD